MGSHDVQSVTLNVKDNGDGPPIIFLHGAWLSSDMWHPQVRQLTSHYRTLSVDLRGHGQSDPGTAEYSVSQFAADLEAVIDKLCTDLPIVCGNSLGGLTAMAYAVSNPVRGLILADTVQSIPPVPLPEWTSRLLLPKPSVYPILRALGAENAFRWLLTSIEGYLGRPWLSTTRDARAYAFSEVASMATDTFVNIFDALYDYRTTMLDNIDAPSLVLYGDHEAPAVKVQSRRLANELKTDIETIPNSGHLANLDNPDAFNQAIHDFITTIIR